MDLFYPELASKKKVGKRIVALRSVKGWTQDDLAERLGIGRTVLSNWEQGRNHPDFESMATLAEITGATMDYLILGRESTLPNDLAAALWRAQRSTDEPVK